VNFRQELSIEQVQMRVTDLCQTIRIRAGRCQEAADAIAAIERAVAPIYTYIRTEGERKKQEGRTI
jgi:hypothetical protein